MELLTHSSYLVRAAASLVLGRLFFGLHTHSVGSTAPPLSKMLSMIRDREMITAGVAGAFLHGANWSVAMDEWDSFSGQFDMRSWFIETLRESGREPEVPHIQTLEFYAHELFAFDGDAIQAFLKMGRRELAVLAATEEPGAIPRLLPLLQEMSTSSDAGIAATIRDYLATGDHHAGLQHLHKRDFKLGSRGAGLRA